MVLLGAVAGDVIGSPWEFIPMKATDFELFNERSKYTDDSVLTLAIASALLIDGHPYREQVQAIGRKYPNSGYGGMFNKWLFSGSNRPYNSYGNGAAMRVSPVAYAFSTIEEVLHEAQKCTEITHNHPEGIKGAQAVASSIYLSRQGATKSEIRDFVSENFKYDLDQTVEGIRKNYSFDETCQGTVPEAIISFLESEDFETAIRKAVSLGGDSDTLACITGSIAEPFYGGVPAEIERQVIERLPEELIDIMVKFSERYEQN